MANPIVYDKLNTFWPVVDVLMNTLPSYSKDIKSFVQQHRQFLGLLLQADVPLSDYDLSVFCGYLSHAASRDGHAARGRIDQGRVLADLMALPPARRSQEALLKALFWWERGHITGKPLQGALNNAPPFSRPVQEALLAHPRRLEFRRQFGRLAEGVTELARSINAMADLVAGYRDAEDPEQARSDLKRAAHRIRKNIQSCDWRGRAGVAWASQVGISPEKSVPAVNKIYLKRLKRAESIFSRLDSFLEREGINPGLEALVGKTYERWRSQANAAIDQEQVRTAALNASL